MAIGPDFVDVAIIVFVSVTIPDSSSNFKTLARPRHSCKYDGHTNELRLMNDR